jgi:hypothetical protein
LFFLGSDGLVRSTYYDPRDAHPAWVPPFVHSRATDVDGHSTIDAISTFPGAVSLFAVSADGTVRSRYFDAR